MTDTLTYALFSLRRAAENAYSWSLTPNEAGALVAEVERLRGVNADLRLMVDGLETAAHEERAAVVAWLREKAEGMPDLWAVTATAYHLAANTFEDGEHRRKEKP